MLFKVERRIPVKRGVSTETLTFTIEAEYGADASRIADELVYATAWKRGVYPDKGHKAKPEKWAMLHAPGVLTVPLVEAA